jgi:hypothetical protein
MKEIIKGIIAEMREFIKNPTIGTKTEREVKLEKYLKGCMKDYADRIEVVVAKMETTTSTCKDSLQVGDMAAMRDALESARDLILPHCNGSTEFAKGCGETVNKIMNALAKPPRNCDLFGGDPKMLYTAWFDWTASPSGMNDDGTVKLTYGEWLLVRAKGGAYANR